MSVSVGWRNILFHYWICLPWRGFYCIANFEQIKGALYSLVVSMLTFTFPPSRWPVSLWYGNNDMSNETKGFVGGLFRWQRGAPTTNRFDSNCIFQKILIKMESMTFENSLLFSNNGVNFENGVKNHILHDSRQMVVCSFLKIVILRIYTNVQCHFSWTYHFYFHSN